jgi:L-ascorbate metabolism protein UlaG (beta-lactamase superfamily)
MRPSLLLFFLLLLASCKRPTGIPDERAIATTSPSTTPAPFARLTYLGVAGWKLESRSGTLLVDPYVTRTAAKNEAEPLIPDERAIAAFLPSRADAILVGHSHFDHVLDVPSIARRTGATVIGTESTVHLALAGDVSSTQVRVARGNDTFEVGPFTVRSVAALHSLTGQKNIPIPSAIRLPLPARAYDEGGTLQYLVRYPGERADDVRTIFFVGTANFIEYEVRSLGVRPDVAVIAVGLREKVPDYTCRLLRALGRPKHVLPNHFDAFREPLRPGAMEPDEETSADLRAFAAEVEACAPGTRVQVPIHLQPIDL